MLTADQIVSIIMLLQAFGVNQAVVDNVSTILTAPSQTMNIPDIAQKTQGIRHIQTVVQQPESPVISRLIYRKYSGKWEIDSNKPLDLSEISFIKPDGSIATSTPPEGWDTPQDVAGLNKKHYVIKMKMPDGLSTFQMVITAKDGGKFTSNPYTFSWVSQLESDLIIY